MVNTLPLRDWSLVQAFLAVVETGSLSQAARDLGLSQPTLGRQIKQIEADLGVTLFTRHPRGLSLSETGSALLPAAQAMRAAMGDFALAAAGHDEALHGTVRITASAVVASHILPEIIAKIRVTEPQISIDLIPSDSSENLLFREADIAVRMYRSEQLDIVTRHIGDIRLGIYAAKSYLDRAGYPRTIDDLRGHDLIGYDRSEIILRGMRAAGVEATRDMFAVRCDDQVTYWALLQAGCGIGFFQSALAELDPDIEAIDLGLAIPPIPVWLAAHQGLRQTPRIRRVWDMLETGLRPFVS